MKKRVAIAIAIASLNAMAMKRSKSEQIPMKPLLRSTLPILYQQHNIDLHKKAGSLESELLKYFKVHEGEPAIHVSHIIKDNNDTVSITIPSNEHNLLKTFFATLSQDAHNNKRSSEIYLLEQIISNEKNDHTCLNISQVQQICSWPQSLQHLLFSKLK